MSTWPSINGLFISCSKTYRRSFIDTNSNDPLVIVFSSVVEFNKPNTSGAIEFWLNPEFPISIELLLREKSCPPTGVLISVNTSWLVSLRSTVNFELLT